MPMPFTKIKSIMFPNDKKASTMYSTRGAKLGGGIGWVATPPEFWRGGGVKYLSTPLILRGFFFNRSHSLVFTCFLDASKAFDTVNHWTLFKKLLLKGKNFMFLVSFSAIVYTMRKN